MNPPSNIKIGPIDMRVEVSVEAMALLKGKDEGRDYYGCESVTQCLLAVQPNLAKPRERETLWHEINHATSKIFRLDRQDKDEEDWVAKFAPLTLAVLRDNPKLVAYLMEKEN